VCARIANPCDRCVEISARSGILSYMIIRDIEIYESFNLLDDDISKEMKYIILAEQYELSTDRIKQIIYNMSGYIK
jgi:DNA polymerase III delta prime subunit